MRIDGRTLTHEVSESIRLMAVRRVREGEAPSTVIASYGLSRTTIYKWLKSADAGGEAALKASKHPGPGFKLSDAQMRKVRSWICGKDPRQHGFDFGLWTRSIIAELIRRRFGISLGLTAVGRLLARLEITPQQPLRRAYERDPRAIERWKQTEFPTLKARAKRAGAQIFFLDEAGVRSDSTLGRTWAPRGETPEVRTSGQRQQVNAISAVNELGAFWFEVYTGKLNAAAFVEFLKRFMRYRRQPVFLVVDGHPSHRANLVANYVASTQGNLELHFLPPYAPDLNPDEFVWSHVRKHGTSKTPLRENESLRTRMQHDLNRIKAQPRLVRSFFRAPSVAYTAV
jgi:transposase